MMHGVAHFMRSLGHCVTRMHGKVGKYLYMSKVVTILSPLFMVNSVGGCGCCFATLTKGEGETVDCYVECNIAFFSR